MNLIEYIKKQTSLYIAVNLFVSMIGFVRSFAFMRWLGFDELGLVSLAQTVMQFISLLQLGLINGGYRLFSLNRCDDQRSVNNTLFSFFAILFGLCLLFWSIIAFTGNRLLISNELLLISIITGVVMLINNWLNNTLIGKQKLGEINRINLLSCFISLIAIGTIPFLSYWGAVLSITIQPLCFVIMTLIRNKDLRPTNFYINFRFIKYILSFGFIPFLAGIITVLNSQIERWAIASVLGNSALGQFYLVFLYHSLFLLIPNSIQNIFFPRAVLSYDKGDLVMFQSIIKKYSIVTIIYNVIIILTTLLFFDSVISILFPLHRDNTIFVYLVLPGFVAISFEGITSLFLNSIVRLKPIFWGSLIGLIVNCIFTTIMILFNYMTLEYMAILKSITLITPVIVCICYSISQWKDIKLQFIAQKKINYENHRPLV